MKRSRVVLIVLSLVLIHSANAGECTPAPSGGRVQHTWLVDVQANTTEHTYDKRLSIPLVNPETREIEVGLYRVFARAGNNSGKPAQPPKFHEALEDSFEAMVRDPDALVEFMNSDTGEEIFFEQCIHLVERDMQTHSLRGKTIEYQPADSPLLQLARAQPWRRVGTCSIIASDGKTIELYIAGKTDTRELRRTSRPAGKMRVAFKVESQGSADRLPDLDINFRVTAEPTQAVDTPAGTEEAVAIKIASYHQRIANEIQTIQNSLNNQALRVTDPEQAQLCQGEGGQLRKAASFNGFDNDYQTHVLLSARKQTALNEGLGGDRCSRINCDCRNINAGILSGAWRAQCRGEQASAIRRCQEDGQVRRCHQAGPNPYYPE